MQGKPDTQKIRCDVCGKKHLHSHGYILEDGEAYAEYMLQIHGDHGDSENAIATIDVVFTYDREPFPVFMSAIRAVNDVEFMLCDPDDDDVGRLKFMSYEEGLRHPLIHRNWDIINYLLEADPYLHKLIYGATTQSLKD